MSSPLENGGYLLEVCHIFIEKANTYIYYFHLDDHLCNEVRIIRSVRLVEMI